MLFFYVIILSSISLTHLSIYSGYSFSNKLSGEFSGNLGFGQLSKANNVDYTQGTQIIGADYSFHTEIINFNAGAKWVSNRQLSNSSINEINYVNSDNLSFVSIYLNYLIPILKDTSIITGINTPIWTMGGSSYTEFQPKIGYQVGVSHKLFLDCYIDILYENTVWDKIVGNNIYKNYSITGLEYRIKYSFLPSKGYHRYKKSDKLIKVGYGYGLPYSGLGIQYGLFVTDYIELFVSNSFPRKSFNNGSFESVSDYSYSLGLKYYIFQNPYDKKGNSGIYFGLHFAGIRTGWGNPDGSGSHVLGGLIFGTGVGMEFTWEAFTLDAELLYQQPEDIYDGDPIFDGLGIAIGANIGFNPVKWLFP